MEFDANNKISSWRNADAQTLRFYYNTYTNLTLVSDAYGRTLTFTYTGNTQLTSIADSSGRSASYTYSAGNLSTYTDPESKTWTYTYDTNHWITSTKDPLNQITVSNVYDAIGCVATQVSANGQTYTFYVSPNYTGVEENPQDDQTTYTFDDDGRQLSKADPLGNTSYSYYDDQGHLTNEVDARGFSTFYYYDSNNNLTSFLNSATSVVQYSYDSDFHLIRKVDEVGNQTGFGYDSEHHLTAITNALGYVTSYVYTDDGLVQTVTDPKGNTQTITYDSRGNPATVARTDGGTETLTYNVLGDLTSHIDPNGHTNTFTFNNRRQPISEGDALGYAVSNIYDSAGNLVTNIDRNGNITRTTYTPTYKVRTVTYADGSIISNAYDNRDFLVSVTDGRGNVSSNQYDEAGRVSAIIDPFGHANYFYYDENGNITSNVDALGYVTRKSYDSLNRLVSVTDPEGNISSNQYDAASRLNAVIDAAGKQTTYAYDELGRRISITRPDGEIESFEYDSIGNMTTFENAKGNRWSFGYDGMNRKTVETNALGYVTRFSYDSGGNLLSKTNANGTAIIYSYDVRNLLTNKQYTGENCTYRYDKNHNLTNLISSTGTNVFRFDSLNRLVAATDPHGNLTSNTFDIVGNRTGIKYPGSLQLSFTFDSANRLTNLTDWVSHSTHFGYDNADRLTDIDYPNSVEASFTIDGNDRVTGYNYGGTTNFIDRTITRNSLGFKTVESIAAGLEPTPPSGKQFRNFNAGDELTHNSQNDYDPDFYEDLNCAYDQNGNMTSRIVTATGAVVSVAYYSYDAENKLSQVSGVSTQSFIYDGSGNLARRIENGVARDYVIDWADPLARPLMETTTNGTPTRYYVWSGQQLVSILETNGSIYYTHFDELGNLLALSDSNGSVVAQFAYTPFGQDAGSSGSVDVDFKYLGAYGVRAIDDNLYLTRHRAYDAELMRALQTDPLGLGGGVNFYAWSGNLPTHYIDPMGLSFAETRWSSSSYSGTPFRNAVRDAGSIVASFIPGVGESMDVNTLFGRNSTRTDRTLAGASLLLSVVTLGTSPNFGAAARVANQAGNVAESIRTERGGLNLFKLNNASSVTETGWKEGDRFLNLPNQGSAKANWMQNSSRLREEMRSGDPIFDSHRNQATGLQIPAGQTPTSGGRFLRAERELLENRGWQYNPQTGAYSPPSGQ